MSFDRPRRPLGPLARILTFWGAALALLLFWGFVRGLVPASLGPLVWGLGGSAAVLLLQAFVRAEHRPFADVGLGWAPWTPARFVAGLGLGVANFVGTLLITAAVLGPIRLTPVAAPPVTAIFATVLGLAAVTTMEELTFRTYPLWTALRSIGFWPAQALVAVAFSLLHLAYGWPPATVATGVLPSALLFGIAAAVSGGMALPLGIHLGINLSRWATGEGSTPGWWTWDASALDPVRAATVAPVVGASVPVLLALALHAGHRLARTHLGPTPTGDR